MTFAPPPRPRRFAVVPLVTPLFVGSLLAPLASCTGRGDVDIAPEEPGPASGTAPDAAPSFGPDAGNGSPVLDAGAGLDATPDAAPARDAAPDAPRGDVCDQDDDGVRAASCGGSDCCDTDPRVYPRDSDEFFTTPSRCGDYRYACGRRVRRQFEVVRCRWESGCVGDGFVREVECGESGTFVACRLARGRCSPDTSSAVSRVQGCR